MLPSLAWDGAFKGVRIQGVGFRISGFGVFGYLLDGVRALVKPCTPKGLAY